MATLDSNTVLCNIALLAYTCILDYNLKYVIFSAMQQNTKFTRINVTLTIWVLQQPFRTSSAYVAQ